MSLKQLSDLVSKFCEDRDWDQFHNPKDLAIGAVTESAELLELFRFKSNEEVQTLLQTENFKERVSDELADILFFVIRFAAMNRIDLLEAFESKIVKNSAKYPVGTSRGSNKKYNE